MLYSFIYTYICTQRLTLLLYSCMYTHFYTSFNKNTSSVQCKYFIFIFILKETLLIWRWFYFFCYFLWGWGRMWVEQSTDIRQMEVNKQPNIHPHLLHCLNQSLLFLLPHSCINTEVSTSEPFLALICFWLLEWKSSCLISKSSTPPCSRFVNAENHK